MKKEEFNDGLRQYFDDMNSVGLGELLLFTDGINQFVETITRRERVLKSVVNICGGYQVNARKFVKLISYEDFKSIPGISEITALGLRLYLLYQCGVDWLEADKNVVGF